MKLFRLLSLLVAFFALDLSCLHAQSNWQEKFQQELPLLGHRNWVVIVDAAYPLQTSPGIEIIETNSDAPEVIDKVLKFISTSRHIRPVFYTDAELPFVAEADAPGITAYRSALKKTLGDDVPQSLPHEQIIAKLDEAGKMFHVLILKTNLRLPYTSLFLQLQCGYWTAEAEQRLRAAIVGSAH